MKSYVSWLICVFFIAGLAVHAKPNSDKPNSSTESPTGSAAAKEAAAKAVEVPTNKNLLWYIRYIKRCLATSCPREIMQEVFSIVENKAAKLNSIDPIVMEDFKNEVAEGQDVVAGMLESTVHLGKVAVEGAARFAKSLYGTTADLLQKEKAKYDNITDLHKAKITFRHVFRSVVSPCRPSEMLNRNDRCIHKRGETGYYKHNTHIYHERRQKPRKT